MLRSVGALVLLSACTASHHDATPGDAGPSDPGTPIDTYPAFPVDAPLLTTSGGPVLAVPRVVTVTWPAEAQADALEALGGRLTQSDYWKQAMHEYVGAGTAGAQVRVAEAFSARADSDLDALVSSAAADSTSGWPSPSAGTMYVLYLPAGKDVTVKGTGACERGLGGYHVSVVVNGVGEVPYAVVLRCSNAASGLSELDRTTVEATHEIVEMAADPVPDRNPAYLGFEDLNTAWTVFQRLQTEVADNCQVEDSPYARSTELSALVARVWSNARASAGSSPCYPAPASPYFNVTPIGLQANKVMVDGQPLVAKSVRVAVGGTATFEVGYYSDRRTADWRLQAIEGTMGQVNAVLNGDSSASAQVLFLGLAVDNTRGRNGNKAVVSVTLRARPPLGYAIATLVSTDDTGIHHFSPVLVVPE